LKYKKVVLNYNNVLLYINQINASMHGERKRLLSKTFTKSYRSRVCVQHDEIEECTFNLEACRKT